MELNLLDKRYILVAKDSSHPQLRHMKKYRIDEFLTFRLPENSCQDLLIDRFTHEIHAENNLTNWVDVVVVFKNVRFKSDDDPRSHCLISISIAGISSSIGYIRDPESLHVELWNVLCDRVSCKLTTEGGLAKLSRKVVISQVQSSCGFQLQQSSTWIDYDAKPTYNLESKLHRCLQNIHDNCPIGIPIYSCLPPMDDPLPLPFIVTCSPGGISNIMNGNHCDWTLDRISTCRAQLSGWKVGQPKYELPASTYLESKDAPLKNDDIDCINVDFLMQTLLTNCDDPKDFIVSFAASNDGRYIVAVTFNSALYITALNEDLCLMPKLNLATLKLITGIPCSLCVYSLKYDDGHLIVYLAYDDGKILCVRVSISSGSTISIKGTILYDVETKIDVTVLCCYDKDNLIIGARDGNVYLLQTSANNSDPCEQKFQTFADDSHKDADDVISCIAVSRTAGLVAAGCTDGSVKLWQVETRSSSSLHDSSGIFDWSKSLFDLKPHHISVTALAFSLSGSILYAGGADGRIVIWDTIMGMNLRTIFESYSLPCKLFSPRSAPTISSTSLENEYNWVAAERCFEKPVNTNLRRIKSLSISPDSSLLTVVFHSGHVVFLDAHVKHLTFTDADLRSISREIVEEIDHSLSIPSIYKDVTRLESIPHKDNQSHVKAPTNTVDPILQVVCKRSSINFTDIKNFDSGIRDTKISDIVILKDRCILGRRGAIQVLNLSEGVEESVHIITNSSSASQETKPIGLLSSADHRVLLAVFDEGIYTLPSYDSPGLHFDEWSRSKASSANMTVHLSTPKINNANSSGFDDMLVKTDKGILSAPSCIPLYDYDKRITCYALERFTGRYLAFVRSGSIEQFDDIYCYAYGNICSNKEHAHYFGKSVCDSAFLELSHNYGICTTISVACCDSDAAVRIVIGTSSGTVVSYLIKDSKVLPLQLLQKHLSQVTCSDIVENGNIIITGSSDRSIIIFDAIEADKSKQILHVLQHDNRVSCLVVCPKTGVLMAGCSGDATILWFWRSGTFLGALQSDSDAGSMHPHDDVCSVAFSECEQILVATSCDGTRAKIHFNAMSKDFQRIHSLAAAKQHGLIESDHFSGLPLDTRRILTYLEHHSVEEVREFCRTNPRELREVMLLHSGWLFSKAAIDSMSLPLQDNVDGSSVFTILGDFDRIKDKLRNIFELLPHGVVLTLTKHGDLIDTLLHKQKSKNAHITKQSVVDLLNFYSFLLGTPAKEVDLNIDENYWLKSRRTSFAPYLGEKNSHMSGLEPFSERVNINKIINLCDSEPLLFANFVKSLKPCRNYDSMRSAFSRKRTRIDLSCNYLLRGSENRIQKHFWTEECESKDLTACDVVVPYFIPLKGVANLRSQFLPQIIQYAEDYSDFSIFRNSVVRMVIEFKWQSFAKNRFKLDFIILFLWNVCVVVNALLMRQYAHQFGKGQGKNHELDTAMIILRVIICLVLLRFLAREILELLGSIEAECKNRDVHKKMRSNTDKVRAIVTGATRYFVDVSNVIDLSVYVLVIIGLTYQSWAFRNPTMHYKEFCNATFAVVMPFLVINLLTDMAVHDRFGSYTSMMIVMIRSSMGVLIILALVIVSFAAAFMLSGVEPSAYTQSFYFFDKALLTVYSYVFGGLSFVDMLHAESPIISVILLVIFRFLVSIVLLNILIGIMATSQNQIMSYGTEAVLMAKANYIVTYENVTFDIPDWLLTYSVLKRGFSPTIPRDCKLEVTQSLKEGSHKSMSTSSTKFTETRHKDVSLGDMVIASNKFSGRVFSREFKRKPYQNFSTMIKRWLASWSFAGVVHHCLDILLFITCSGAVIDPAKKKQQFPEYIQILSKDGIDLETNTTKVVREWK